MSRWHALSTRPLYVLLAATVLALAIWGLWPRAMPVETAIVSPGPLSVTFTEIGRTRLRDRYLVSAPLNGVVERIELEAGDRVHVGETLALLRPANAALFDPGSRAEAESRWRTASDDLEAAVAAVAAADATHDRQRAALRRAESLVAQKLIAIDQRDEIRALALAADANLRAAQARVQAARIRVETARSAIDLQGKASRTSDARLPLRSPIEGRVIRRFVESQGPVAAGQSLLELGDPRALEVIVEALTEDAVRLSPGTRVSLLRWGGSTPLLGHVYTIEPGGFTKTSALGVEEQRVLVVVAIDQPVRDWQMLGDGFRVEAQFVVWHAPSVVTVPVAALFRDGADWAVYAAENGRARLRRVQIGHVGETHAELRAGLEPGARVVLYPSDQLRDGKRIEHAR